MKGRLHLQRAFDQARSERRTGIIPYFVAGYPDLARTRELLWEAQEAGCLAVELGIPFSDPVADGPTLQVAIHHALQRGVHVRQSLELVKQLRAEGFHLPVLGMTYANLLYAPGYERAAAAWAEAGLSGAIVPDVPLDEGGALRTALHRHGLGTVSFASPGTGPARLERVLRARDSFVYLVAVYGTTGARQGVAPETLQLLRRARRARTGIRPPLCVGFGVSRPADVAELARGGADAAILGSALVPRIDRGDDVKRYLSSLVRAARKPTETR